MPDIFNQGLLYSVLKSNNIICVRTTATQYFTMSLDLYTRYIPLTQKAQFWGNYVSALKGRIVYISLHILLMIIYQVTLTCALPLSPA